MLNAENAASKKNKRIKNAIFRGVIIVAVGLLVGIQAYLLNARKLMGNTMPMPFGYGAAVVLSGSMEPTLSVDDLIIVRAADTYAVNDVIVFQDREMLVVHRLIAIDDTSLLTKGDANNTADAPIDAACVKGRVIGHIPGIGGVIRLIRMPAVTFALIALAIWLMERSYREERMEDIEKLEEIKREIRRLREEGDTSNEEKS